MKPISKLWVAVMLIISLAINAQFKNTKTETVKIYGNCDQCKSMIENSGTVKNVSLVSWNKDSQMATLTYDASKTSQGEILKKIAYAGYDSDSYYAPDEAYAELPECCKYERNKKTAAPEAMEMKGHDHSSMAGMNEKQEAASPLKEIFDGYFAIKDALVKTDGKMAAAKAKELSLAVNSVKMEKLSMAEHDAWMKVMNGLNADAKTISQTSDVKKQREAFKTLSENMFAVLKTSKQSVPVYYQHCPMQDANWLSKESTIKNPYYGSQMITCGSTLETIK